MKTVKVQINPANLPAHGNKQLEQASNRNVAIQPERNQFDPTKILSLKNKLTSTII